MKSIIVVVPVRVRVRRTGTSTTRTTWSTSTRTFTTVSYFHTSQSSNIISSTVCERTGRNKHKSVLNHFYRNRTCMHVTAQKDESSSYGTVHVRVPVSMTTTIITLHTRIVYDMVGQGRISWYWWHRCVVLCCTVSTVL